MSHVIDKCRDCGFCKQIDGGEFRCEQRARYGHKPNRLKDIDKQPTWCPLPESDEMST